MGPDSVEDERAAYRAKLRSLAFRGSSRRTKTTVDAHDHHSVEVTEHWNDRVDVTVKPEPITVTPP